MKKFTLWLLLVLAIMALAGCSQKEAANAVDKTTIYLNGNALSFAKEGNTDLKLLSVENGITIDVEKPKNTKVTVNGQEVGKTLLMGISSITREDTLEFVIETKEETTQ